MPPKLVSYRDYKKFSQERFRYELEDIFTYEKINNISNDEFVNTFTNIFEKHAPLKFKSVRANEGPFMNKELRKAIMLRSKFRNKFNRLKTESAKIEYNKQRNLCTSLLRKAKRQYYSNLDPSCVK